MSEQTTPETAETKPTAAATEAPAKTETKTETKAAPAAEAKTRVQREAVGVVVSTKGAKTIVVRVERRVPHPRFKKIIRVSNKFHAHDAETKAAEGDKVRIRECRPVSKLKNWELVEVLQH